MLIYCSIVLSRVKLTNAHTVGGRPTQKNNTECFRNGLVRELKEKQRKFWNIELLPDFRPTCYRFQLIVTIDWFHQIPTFFARLTEKENGGWDGTGKIYFHSPIFAVWNGTPSFNLQHQYVWIVCKKRGGLCRLTESVCVVASNKRGWKAYTTFTSCENVAYSNKVFFLCWVGYALEGSIFSLSKCDFSRMFHTERSWHTYRFTVVIVSGRQDLPSGCKRIFFDLFWSVKLFSTAEWGFQYSPKCVMDLHN